MANTYDDPRRAPMASAKRSPLKIVPARVHAPLDYVAVALFALAPTLFGFAGLPAFLCYAIAAVQLIMSALTKYNLSLAKIIPFPVHGYIELAMTPLLLAAPWIFGFSEIESARNFFIATGIGLGLLWLVTDYRSTDYASDRVIVDRTIDRDDRGPARPAF